MSMDRRNKKAAQQAAQQTAKDGNGSREKEKDRDKARTQRNSTSTTRPGSSGATTARPISTQARTGLLSGSTAPTRVLASGASRPPLPISKAVPAPAAPAPTLNDTDFTSVETPKNSGDLSSPTENVTPTATSTTNGGLSPDSDAENPPNQSDPKIELEESGGGHATPQLPVGSPPSSSGFFPVASPTQPVRFSGRHGSTPSVDFGPIGSPPRSSPATRVNGFSPGTSPREGAIRPPPIISGSPFSAPGSQSLFMPFERANVTAEPKTRSGLAMSLGATRTLGQFRGHRGVEIGVEVEDEDGGVGVDGDLEEFVPSSLTDLLTPEEQSRRMSRASSGNANAGVGAGLGVGGTGLAGAKGIVSATVAQDNRFSRSVPAPSPLGDLRSIWTADPRNETPVGRPVDVLGGTGTGRGHGQHTHAHPLTLGSPSSFNSGSGFATRGTEGPSPSLLSPSNASAAFLPSLHQHYLSRPPPGSGRGVSGAFVSGGVTQQQQQSSAFGNLNGISVSPSRLTDSIGAASQSIHGILSSSPSALHHQHLQHVHPTGRPIPSKGYLNPELPLSPSARALQAHAPGQSLPQGLAAGYSRIHAQPLPNIPSPAMSGTTTFSPGSTGTGYHMPVDIYGGQDWGTGVSGIGVGLGNITNGNYASALTGPPASSTLAGIVTAPMPTGSVVGTTTSNASMDTRAVGAADTATPPLSGGVESTTPAITTTSVSTGVGDRDTGGLTTMFSRLSYSAAAARGTSTTASTLTTGTSVSPMARKTSGQRWTSHPMSSPLGGPVLTNDDDVLFSMDEVK